MQNCLNSLGDFMIPEGIKTHVRLTTQSKKNKLECLSLHEGQGNSWDAPSPVDL